MAYRNTRPASDRVRWAVSTTPRLSSFRSDANNSGAVTPVIVIPPMAAMSFSSSRRSRFTDPGLKPSFACLASSLAAIAPNVVSACSIFAARSILAACARLPPPFTKVRRRSRSARASAKPIAGYSAAWLAGIAISIPPNLRAAGAHFFDAQAVGVREAVRVLTRLECAQLGIGEHVSQPSVNQPPYGGPSDSQRDSLCCWIQSDSPGQKRTKKPAICGVYGRHLDLLGQCRTLMWWAHQDSNLEPKDYESSALTVEL